MYNIINKFEIVDSFSKSFLDNLSGKIMDKVSESPEVLSREDVLVGGTAFHDIAFENTSMSNVWVDYIVKISHKDGEGDMKVTFERIIIYDEIPDQVLDAINQHKNINKIIEDNVFDERLSVLMEKYIERFKAKLEFTDEKEDALLSEYITFMIFLQDEDINPHIFKIENGKRCVYIKGWDITMTTNQFRDIQNYIQDYIEGNLLSIIHYVNNPPKESEELSPVLFAMFVLQYREWFFKTFDVKEEIVK